MGVLLFWNEYIVVCRTFLIARLFVWSARSTLGSFGKPKLPRRIPFPQMRSRRLIGINVCMGSFSLQRWNSPICPPSFPLV